MFCIIKFYRPFNSKRSNKKITSSEDQPKKEDDRPVFENSKTATILEYLEGLISGLAWWSGWKLDQTYFLGHNWTQKSHNCPKSISPEPFVVESWFTPQNDRNTYFIISVLYPSDNRKCPKNTAFCFMGPYIDKIAWFFISREPLML